MGWALDEGRLYFHGKSTMEFSETSVELALSSSRLPVQSVAFHKGNGGTEQPLFGRRAVRYICGRTNELLIKLWQMKNVTYQTSTRAFETRLSSLRTRNKLWKYMLTMELV